MKIVTVARGFVGFALGALPIALLTVFVASNPWPMIVWGAFCLGLLVPGLVFWAFGNVWASSDQYQAGGHCGCCGVWVAEEVVPKEWPFTLCGECKRVGCNPKQSGICRKGRFGGEKK